MYWNVERHKDAALWEQGQQDLKMHFLISTLLFILAITLLGFHHAILYIIREQVLTEWSVSTFTRRWQVLECVGPWWCWKICLPHLPFSFLSGHCSAFLGKQPRGRFGNVLC
jgi:hypothetical protein